MSLLIPESLDKYNIVHNWSGGMKSEYQDLLKSTRLNSQINLSFILHVVQLMVKGVNWSKIKYSLHHQQGKCSSYQDLNTVWMSGHQTPDL